MVVPIPPPPLLPCPLSAGWDKLAEVRDLLKPFAERGSFIDEARGVLGEERAAQARAMVDAWRAARIEELRKELGDAAQDDARLAAR